jgi:hypothetical protein
MANLLGGDLVSGAVMKHRLNRFPPTLRDPFEQREPLVTQPDCQISIPQQPIITLKL